MALGDDCDDARASVFPGGVEVCNGLDDDCDTQTDEDATDATIWYRDADGDGHGQPADPADPASTKTACEAPQGYAALGDDCDDLHKTVFPGADEVCNGLDDDCDTQTDEDATDATTWYRDADGDGFGVDDDTTDACEAPDGYVAQTGDCDDAPGSGAGVYPGADELCNGLDDDCDAQTDEDATDATTWYRDDDGDGFGVDDDTTEACEAPDGYVAQGGDCDDTAATGGACHAGCQTFYADNDGDQVGDPATALAACAVPAGYVVSDTDCNPSSAAHWSDCATCQDGDGDGYGDGCDLGSDCDDDASSGVACHDGCQTFYADVDGDGHGDPQTPRDACAKPGDYADDDVDCDDADPATYLGAPELCDGKDNDCDLSEQESVVPTDFPTIQAGLDDAAATGDAVCVLPGTYTENLVFPAGSVRLEGLGGALKTTIQPQDPATPVVTFDGGQGAGTIFRGFTVRGADVSAALLNGGGVVVQDASPTLQDLVLTDNTARSGGGLAILGLSNPTVERVTLSANTATERGGGLFVSGGAMPTLIDLTVTACEANFGGAVAVEAGGTVAEFTRLTATDNTVSGNGAGLYCAGICTLHQSRLSANATANTVNRYGGGIFMDQGGKLTADHLELTDNWARSGGAGLHVDTATVTLQYALIAGNEVLDGSSAGIYTAYSTLTLDHAAVVGNHAGRVTSPFGGLGGGLGVSSGSTVTVRHTDISHNAADVNGGGVWLWTPGDTTLTIEHSNAWENTGANGAPSDLYVANGGPGAFPDPFAADNALGNLTAAPGYADLGADAAADWDLHLAPTSPLVDAGDPATHDPDGGACDVGVYGGPQADAWDVDGDGFARWWQPGPYDAASGLDCDDHDPGVIPGGGC